jgi:hypothetical protein
MYTLSIDITAIVAIWITGALLMVPVLGFTVRLVAPPIIEAMARASVIREAATNGRTAADAHAYAADAEAVRGGF